MEFEDQKITCQDCGKEFDHTAEDQKRYADRGFTEPPKRCRECRQIRKEKASASKGHSRRPPQGGGGRPHGGERGFHGPPRQRSEGFRSDPGKSHGMGHGPGHGQSHGTGHGPGGGGGGGVGGQGQMRGRQSYKAACAACGSPTTVPFEPTPGREVFCRSCLRKMREE